VIATAHAPGARDKAPQTASQGVGRAHYRLITSVDGVRALRTEYEPSCSGCCAWRVSPGACEVRSPRPPPSSGSTRQTRPQESLTRIMYERCM